MPASPYLVSTSPVAVPPGCGCCASGCDCCPEGQSLPNCIKVRVTNNTSSTTIDGDPTFYDDRTYIVPADPFFSCTWLWQGPDTYFTVDVGFGTLETVGPYNDSVLIACGSGMISITWVRHFQPYTHATPIERSYSVTFAMSPDGTCDPLSFSRHFSGVSYAGTTVAFDLELLPCSTVTGAANIGAATPAAPEPPPPCQYLAEDPLPSGEAARLGLSVIRQWRQCSQGYGVKGTDGNGYICGCASWPNGGCGGCPSYIASQ